MTANTLIARPLSAVGFVPFGHVLGMTADSKAEPANRGTAQMVGHLGQVINLRPEKARQNWKIYRCRREARRPVPLLDLERHPFSSQMFVPLGGRSRFLVTVALGEHEPDLATLQAFLAEPDQGIIYHPGVWHQPMTVVDRVADMLSLVYEDGTADDCHVLSFDPEVRSFIQLGLNSTLGGGQRRVRPLSGR